MPRPNRHTRLDMRLLAEAGFDVPQQPLMALALPFHEHKRNRV
jgi:hypothetical protein